MSDKIEKESFLKLELSKEMIKNLSAIGYDKMTPIQLDALPHILASKDVLAQAKTGSGKTAAFGIGILENLDVKKFRVQSLVLCPTRELADQVAKELRRIAKFKHNIKILTLCGGESFGKQLNSLSHQAHIVVGTPGRVLKHLKKESLELTNLKTLVLDEADRMLDMGFSLEIEEVLSFTPKQKQTLLFSATYTDEVLDISDSLQVDAVVVKTISNEEPNKITQHFYQTQNKFQTLIDILSNFKVNNAIVFTNTKIQAKELAEDLQDKNIDALAIHGDLEQYERNDVLVQFANKSCPILIATDVAARGLDIKELCMVVNYDIPHEKEIYTHRIGRTARAGKDGLAFSLFDDGELQKADEYKDDKEILFTDASSLKTIQDFEMKPLNVTLVIEGGKKDKIRAGDILGALTAGGDIKGECIGKIDIYDRQSYVAIKRAYIDDAYNKLKNSKIKAKKFSVWIV
jgi:ATP-independent RNA helicase DbpA